VEDVPLDEIVAEAMDATRGAREAGGVTVRTATGLPVVPGDRTRLREVVQNLLANAIRFSAEVPAPEVELGVREGSPREVVVFLRDNGIGIDPRHQDRIFHLFEKLDSGREGAGIGLALVRRIIDGHHGRLWVESEGEGMGATFCFALPRTAPGDGKGTPEPGDAP
jgi:signal transduction histidine kinase